MYKEWIDVTTFDDLVKGFGVYKEMHTGDILEARLDGSGCSLEG